jgi:paraquat-inducible protein B
MPENTNLPVMPSATNVPKRRMRPSAVWIIPLLAVVVSIGIAIQRIMSQGPTITIQFKSAEGVEASKTFVKYKEVNIGQVTAVTLSPDFTKVLVTAQIAKSAEGLLVDDAKFWVVEPRVTLRGVSGLGTLLAGNYIGFEVGTSKKKRREYVGLEVPPPLTIGEAGRQFVLRTQDLGSLGNGSPLYYRRLNVGQVIAYGLADDGKAIDVKVFVYAPYDRYVTTSTRFWNASGVDVSIGAQGVEVRTQSLISLLAGGIVFDETPLATGGEPAAENTTFTLYNDRAAAMAKPPRMVASYVARFSESLRGLSVGAPMTFLGLPVGEVTKIGVDVNPQTFEARGLVEVAAYPERLLGRLQEQGEVTTLEESQSKRRALIDRLVEQRGLRAQLRSGSLLTGQLYVALDYFPDAAKASIDWTHDPPEFPTVPSTVVDLEARLTAILAKLEKLNVEQIDTDVRKSLAELTKTLASADTLVKHLDTEVTPEVRAAIAQAQRALGPDSPLQLDARSALQEVSQAARALRVLADYLERNPSALLRGKSPPPPSTEEHK